VGNGHGEHELGSNGSGEPNPFLRLRSGLEEYQVKVKNLGGPCIEEHEIGFLPVIIEAEGREVFLDFRSRELSSSGFAVTLNKIFVNGSGIPRRRMDTKEDKAIRSLDFLFQDAENEALLLLK
jgi:hypothetical protein